MTDVLVQQATSTASYNDHKMSSQEAGDNNDGNTNGGFIDGMRERQDSGRGISMLQRIRRRLSRGISGSSDTERGFTAQTSIDTLDGGRVGSGDQQNTSLISSVTTTTSADIAASDNNDSDASASGGGGGVSLRRKSSGRKVSDVFRRRFYTSGQSDLSQSNKIKQHQQQRLLAVQEQATALGSQSSMARGLRRVQSDSSLGSAARVCAVCLKIEASDPKTGLRLKSFGGLVCVDCFRHYVERKILACESYHMPSPVPVNDLMLKTDTPVDWQEIERYCGPELLDRYLLLNTIKRAELKPQYVSCCTPGCGNRIPIDAALMNQPSVRFYARCLRCSAEYCPKCKIPKNMHFKAADCGAARAVYERHIHTDSIRTKSCPKCGHANDKLGSAQIDCPECHMKYCWFCCHNLDNDEYLLHFTQGACKGRLGAKQPNITPHHLESTFLLAGVGLVMLASTPLLLVGMPVYAAAKMGRKAWKKRQMRRAESVGERNEGSEIDEQQQEKQTARSATLESVASGGGDAGRVRSTSGGENVKQSHLLSNNSFDEHRKSSGGVGVELIREEPEAEQAAAVAVEQEKLQQITVTTQQ